MPVMSRLMPTLAFSTEAAPRQNHGQAIISPRMRACSTVVFQPCPLPWTSSKSERLGCSIKALDGEHESRVLKKRSRQVQIVNATESKTVQNGIELRLKRVFHSLLVQKAWT